MKKFWLFLFSSLIAMGIAYYSKKAPSSLANKPGWNTFEKKSATHIAAYPSTGKELQQARIPTPKRGIAQERNDSSNGPALPKDHAYQIRENRLLIGDIDRNNYQNENTELVMLNKINPDWKTILGNDLLRFQEEDTKVMIKEEFPVIKVQNGKGLYLEQVIVTYVFKNGNFSSFHALVDSDTGFVTETWDRTVHEKVKAKRAEITLPDINNSGIITR